MKVKYVDLSRQWEVEREDLLPKIDRCLSSGDWVGGSAIEDLEDKLAKFIGVSRVVALSSGTDALMMALHAVGVKPGDEVITVPNSFIASTAAICHLGATPVFIDVLPDQNMNPELIEGAISEKTQAILPVHLTGHMADMEAICDKASQFGVAVVEDAAQAIGAAQNSRQSGTWGEVSCFSTHPLKNLNSAGDGGFVATNDNNIANRIQIMRSHGIVQRDTIESFGLVSRLDTLQAQIVLHRLEKLPEVIEQRRKTAQKYRSALEKFPIFLPFFDDSFFDTFHTFVIQLPHRDQVKAELEKMGVQTRIHYPRLIVDQPALQARPFKVIGSLSKARRQSSTILSLPIHQNLSEAEQEWVINSISPLLAKVNRLENRASV